MKTSKCELAYNHCVCETGLGFPMMYQYLSCSISNKSLYDSQVHNFSIAIDSIVNVFTLFTNNWRTKSMPGSQVQQLRKNNWTHHSWVYLHQLLCRPERIEKSFNKTQ